MAASRCGHTDVVRKLLGAGAVVGPDEPVALTGFSALAWVRFYFTCMT